VDVQADSLPNQVLFTVMTVILFTVEEEVVRTFFKLLCHHSADVIVTRN